MKAGRILAVRMASSCIACRIFHIKRWQLAQQGRFPFNKNSGLKFRKFHVPNGTVHSGCTDPTQATARFFIVLVSRIQNSGTGDNNFVKWKGTFHFFPTEMTGPVKVDHLQRWSQILRSDRNANRNGPFHFISYRNFQNFGLNGQRLQFPAQPQNDHQRT